MFPLHTPLVLFPVADFLALKVACLRYVFTHTLWPKPYWNQTRIICHLLSLRSQFRKKQSLVVFSREVLELITPGEIRSCCRQRVLGVFCITPLFCCYVIQPVVNHILCKAVCVCVSLWGWQMILGGLNVNCLISPISHFHFCYTQYTHALTHSCAQTEKRPVASSLTCVDGLRGRSGGSHTHAHPCAH